MLHVSSDTTCCSCKQNSAFHTVCCTSVVIPRPVVVNRTAHLIQYAAHVSSDTTPCSCKQNSAFHTVCCTSVVIPRPVVVNRTAHLIQYAAHVELRPWTKNSKQTTKIHTLKKQNKTIPPKKHQQNNSTQTKQTNKEIKIRIPNNDNLIITLARVELG